MSVRIWESRQVIHVALLDTTIQGTPGSMGRYREQLLTAIRRHADQEIQATVINLGLDQAAWNRTPRRLRMWRHHLHCRRNARRVDLGQYNVAHLLDGSFGYVASHVGHRRVVVTVHDVIPRLQIDGVFPNAPPVGKGARFIIRKSLAGVANSSLAVSVSQSTATDLRRYGSAPGGGIEVVPMAIETELFCRSNEPKPDNLPSRYVLHLGNNGFYKNRLGTLEVFAELSKRIPDIDLVMAGPAPDETLVRALEQTGSKHRVIFEISPTQNRLLQLYSHAEVFLFPSLYEGFGWPPLEAMSVQCPVVSTNAGSLPEVVGDAGVVADVGDISGLADGCERVVTDRPFRQQLIDAGNCRVQSFTTLQLAQRMTNVYQRGMN